MGKRKGKEHEDRNRESVRKKESQCKNNTAKIHRRQKPESVVMQVWV